MPRGLTLLCALSAALLLAALGWLGALERGEPLHVDLELDSGLSATLYLPASFATWPQIPPPAAERPPAVVVVHGFASDRAGVSTLARRLAEAGYAALAPDLPGHGESRAGFRRDPTADANAAAVATAVDFLRPLPWVDGARIAVVGHSMGASAVLRFAELDTGIDAAVMISGGFQRLGPHRPPNALFVWADRDPAMIRSEAANLAAQIAGVPGLEPGGRSGRFEDGSAVRAVELAGNDHSTILWSRAAAREIVGWLDAAFARERAALPEFEAPRLAPLALAAAALPLALLGLGALAGTLAPRREPRARDARGLLLLGAGLLLALPPVAATAPARFLGLEVADVVVGWLAIAGIGLLALLAARGELPAAAGTGVCARSLAAGGLAFGAVYAVLAPLGVVAHRLALTPERAPRALLAAALLLPFFVAFHALVRRGTTGAALATGAAGRLLLLLALLAGVWLGALPFVVILLLGFLVLVFAFSEIVVGALYARSRDLLAPALFDAAFLGWMLAAVAPLR